MLKTLWRSEFGKRLIRRGNPRHQVAKAGRNSLYNSMLYGYPAGMAEPHVISALVKKRAELAGEIEATHRRLSQMIADLEKLDSTILMFDPEYQVEGIKPRAFRPPSDWSHKGEMTRAVLKILRLASEPLTTRDIALQLMAERAVDRTDKNLLRTMSKRVGVAARRLRSRGLVRSEQGPGQYMLYELNRAHGGRLALNDAV